MDTTGVTRRKFLKRLTVAAAAGATVRAPGLAADAVAVGSLRGAMDRAAGCCLAWLNPQQQSLPTGGYEVAHDTGRWWDAMLRYEAATGVRIPPQAETAMLGNLRRLTANPAGLLTAGICNPHNLRESLLAYTALVRYRRDDWARQQGRKLVAAIASLLRPDGQLDYAGLAALMAGNRLTKDPLMVPRASAGGWFNSTGSTGRAIEAIVWFHEATGDREALDLARRLAEVHLRHVIDPTGRVRAELLDPRHVGHTHSYCGTLRGLLLYGLASGERKYVDAVAKTYRHGLWGTSISHSGWTPHDQGKIRFPNKEGEPIGEHASCGDVAQIGLWLALRAGQMDLFDDAERLIRARLLPSQIVDVKNPRRDGAWGVYTHPFGYGAILDVFAAVLHTLADVDQHVVTAAPDGSASVNLHFSIDTPSVRTRSERGPVARLHVTPNQKRGLRIRVPGWASRESVALQAAGRAIPFRWDGSFVVVDQQTVVPGREMTLQHDLPARQTSETMPVSGRLFRLAWRGDEVAACAPPVPIYPRPLKS